MSSIEVPKSLSASQSGPSVVQWFWQGDPDPWKKDGSNKLKWEPYSPEHCIIIEEALSKNQNMVDIGIYEVDLKKMLQINKKDLTKIRRVWREDNNDPQNRFMIQLPKPLVLEKTQVINGPALGSVQNFLNSFMRRVPEAYRIFYKILKLGLDCKKNEYEDIIQDVIKCLEKAGESREGLVTSKVPAMPEKFIQEANGVIAEIETRLSKYPDMKLRDFFKLILTVYTMDTFIGSWVNELLETENWEKINVLTPYLVLFIYAFQTQDLIYKPQEPQSFRSSVMSLLGPKKLILYRGAAISQENLKQYSPGNSGLFSWNTVISTLKTKEEALKHIPILIRKAKQEVKGVLFKIESEVSSDYEGVIDITQHTRSFGNQEILLAPGSVFEIISSKENKKHQIYEIKLKLIKKIKDINKLREDLIFKIIFNDKASIKELAPDELIVALQLLEGNKTIQKLEIERCLLNPHLMELVEYARITTNIQKENVILKNNQIVSDSLNTLCRYYSSVNLGDM